MISEHKKVGGFKGFRIFAWIVFGFLLLGVLFVGGVMIQYPVRAVLWHCTHGGHVNIGSARLVLPLFWWPGKNEQNGTITLRHAKIDTSLAFMPNELRLIPLPPAKAIRDDEDAALAQSLLARSQNTVPITITAPTGKIFCGRYQAVPEFPTLICFSSGARLKMFFGPGSTQEESEAESILATLE